MSSRAWGRHLGRGGYNGGSTVIGPWRAWSFDPDFVLRDKGRPAVPLTRGKQQRPPAEPAITVAGTAIGKKVIRKHRQAVLQKIDRDTVLVALGLALPKKPAARRDALKQLIADRVLLPTGVINIDHPPVVAWLKTNRKKSKQHG